MTQLEKLKEELKRLTEKINKLEEKPVKNKRFKPELGQIYYTLESDGEIYDSIFSTDFYDNLDYDYRYRIRNCFETKKEAENYKKYIEIENKIHDIADELNGDQEIDWENMNQYKCIICYETSHKRIKLDKYVCTKFNSIYCLSDQFLNVCLERIGNDDLLFYFNYR